MEYIEEHYDSQKSLSEYLEAFVYRRGWATAIFTLGIICTLLTALLIPPTYQSSSLILIEQQEIPQDLVRSTITSYADQRIQVISHRVLTSDNMLGIIKKYNLYEDERRTEPTEYILELMREDITLELMSADVVDPRNSKAMKSTIAFKVGFNYSDAKIAQQVANELTSLFLNENLEERTRQTVNTESFLNDEASKLRDQLIEQEARLAKFKQQNANALPELLSFNHKLYDRTEQELIETRRNLAALKDQAEFLRQRLAQLDPQAMVYRDLGGKVISPEGQLKYLKTRYIELKSKYSADHPDIIRTRREIDSLEKQLGLTPTLDDDLVEELHSLEQALEEARQVHSDEHPDIKRLERSVLIMRQALEDSGHDLSGASEDKAAEGPVPDNPDYIQLQSQLNAVETEIKTLQQTHGQLVVKLKDYEDRLTRSPLVEQDYREYVRDYDNAALKFREIKDKQLEAEMAKSLETERRGERFTMIEPPRVPEEPVSPNRIAILFLGIVLSLLAAVSTVFMLESLDSGIRSGKQLGGPGGHNVLAVIPYITTEAEEKSALRKTYMLAALLLIAVVAVVAYIHIAVMPLDVVFYVLLRKFTL